MSRASSSLMAYLLVTHGSRDRRPQDAMETIIHQLCTHSSSAGTDLSVGAAVLELGLTPLRSQIVEFVEREQLPPGSRLRILPLFLLAGVHVMEDIPEEIAAAQMQLGDRLRLEIFPYFGASSEHLVFLLQQAQARFMEPVPHHWILLAHGSRRSQAVATIETLAESLGMETAYWVQKDSLRLRVIEAMEQFSNSDQSVSNSQSLVIGVLPCFLFEGGLTDAIARQVLELGLEFPQVELRLGPTLSALPGFLERVQAAMVQPHLD